MPGITKLALIVALPIVVICGCETQPEPVTKSAPTPSAPTIIIKAPPSNPEVLSGVGPSGAQGHADRRQAVIDLLTDGRSAESLPLAATAPGEEFDPKLAEKLAPKVWVSDRPRSRSDAQVRQGKATVQGSLDKEIIRRLVRTHINEVRSCYSAGLKKNPKLAGRVTVNFVISGSGTVVSSMVESTTLADTTVENCIAKAVKRWRFPKPTGDANVIVSYPFDLSPE
jgi:hypothetical protein